VVNSVIIHLRTKQFFIDRLLHLENDINENRFEKIMD
jgi:hypothetical protein